MRRTSKWMSFLLRHHPEKVGLKLDRHGFVDLDELSRLGNIEKDLILKIVEEDKKGRYTIEGTRIRANYGHSVPIGDIYAEKNPCTLEDLPETLYHGTPTRNIDRIKKQGLRSMKRKYVHLSPTMEWAKIVGNRMSKQIVILQIDVDKAMKQGVKFWIGSESTIVASTIPPEAIKFD